MFPPEKFIAKELIEVDPLIILAQWSAIGIFGTIQPLLASGLLLYADKWYHYTAWALVAGSVAASGSPLHKLDTVRASTTLFVWSLLMSAIGGLCVVFIFK